MKYIKKDNCICSALFWLAFSECDEEDSTSVRENDDFDRSVQGPDGNTPDIFDDGVQRIEPSEDDEPDVVTTIETPDTETNDNTPMELTATRLDNVESITFTDEDGNTVTEVL